ncbi:hypothetical protein JB92DRAFT_2994481 [Gautieria morchelliformis]|nr:hypothetical protein JB92DRAFT_2994481 [Gautieria morchelliformis]
MMLSQVFALALIASASAQSISITSPGPNTWWVSNSLNTLAWSPCPNAALQSEIPAFNVVVMNSNQQVLAGNLTFLGNQPTFDCSKTITPQNIPVGTGYTMFLTNAINTNQVYTSTTFEMKAQGSTYPPPVSSSSSPSATANSSGTAASSSSSATAKPNAASPLLSNLQGLLGAVVGAGAIVGLL